MPRTRVVGSESVPVSISDGDVLILRKRLNNGETSAAFSRKLTMLPDGSYVVDPIKTGNWYWLISAYLVDWTLVDATGALIPIRGLKPHEIDERLDILDDETVSEIADAVKAHDKAIMVAAAEEKKLRESAHSSEQISPSPDAVAGLSTTSEA